MVGGMGMGMGMGMSTRGIGMRSGPQWPQLGHDVASV